jgi:hypothetical protein
MSAPVSALASLETLAQRRAAKRLRLSSYDRAGGNDDRIYLAPGCSGERASGKPGRSKVQ